MDVNGIQACIYFYGFINLLTYYKYILYVFMKSALQLQVGPTIICVGTCKHYAIAISDT